MIRYLSFVARYSFIFFAVSLFLIIPPNAGSDELWSARSAWYLVENPGQLFQKSQIINYSFPGSLSMESEIPGQGIPYPCFFENDSTPSSCQELLEDDIFQKGQLDRVFRSPLFYFFVGFGMKIDVLDNIYWSGKLFAFLINLFILMLGYRLLQKLEQNSLRNFQAFAMSLLPIYFFSITTISPISFEISCAFLFVSSILHANSGTSEFGNKRARFIFVGFTSLLLALSRPIGGIWGMLLLATVFTLTKPNLRVIRFSIFSLLVGLLIQTRIDNSSWRFGNGEKYNIDPSLQFYLEESVRVAVNIGNWSRQVFGLWTFGAAPELPSILTLTSFSIFSFLIYWFYVQNQSRKVFLSFFLFATLIVPYLFSLVFAAQWPMWWSGRYQLPYLLPCAYLLSLQLTLSRLRLLYVLSILVLTLSYIVIFSRFNWGLYANGTPVLQNGTGFSISQILLSITCFFSWLFLSIFMYKDNFKKVY